MSKRLLFCISFLLLSVGLQAQLRERPVSIISTPYQDGLKRAVRDTVQVALPFWDDFSTSSNEPDSSRWLFGEHVFVNEGFAFQPASKKTATLDGLDRYGVSYSAVEGSRGAGDSLVSQPINMQGLNAADSVYLSYYVQQKGFGRAPSSFDTLYLYFYGTDKQWTLQKKYAGRADLESAPFTQEFIRITDPKYFFDSFQFKFTTYHRTTGNFDIWNIDYVYLNRARTVNRKWHLDRAMASKPASPFKRFTSIPYLHLSNLAQFDSVLGNSSFLYHNLFNQPTGVNYIGLAVDQRNGSIIDTLLLAGSSNTLPGQHLTINANTLNDSRFGDFIKMQQDSTAQLAVTYFLQALDTLLRENVNGEFVYYPQYDLTSNDTTTQVYYLQDYYAYDDGSAESSVELVLPEMRLAVEFEQLENTGYLSAVDVFFPAIAKNQKATNIEINVWSSISNRQQDLIHAEGYPVLLDSAINKFTRYTFELPVLVSKKFYVGYRQIGDNLVSIGFDKNTNNVDKMFEFQGDDWQQVQNLEGTIMIRPVFDPNLSITATEKIIEKTNYKIYPNPNSGSFFIEGQFTDIQAFDINGRKVPLNIISIDYNKNKIDLQSLNKNLIFLRIFDGETYQIHKILVR